MTPFEAYMHYSAIKAHFTQKEYDAVKYQFKIRVKRETYEKRRDKYFFNKLAKHNDLDGFLVSLFIRNPDLWVGDMIQGNAEADEIYLDWKKRTQSLKYTFTEDLKKLNLRTCMKLRPNQLPEVLILMLQGEISIETVTILVDLIKPLDYWKEGLKNDVIYEKYGTIIQKYRPFLTYNKAEFSKILSKEIRALSEK